MEGSLGIKRHSLTLGGRGHTSAAVLHFDLEQALSSPACHCNSRMKAGVDLGLQGRTSLQVPKHKRGEMVKWSKVVQCGQCQAVQGRLAMAVSLLKSWPVPYLAPKSSGLHCLRDPVSPQCWASVLHAQTSGGRTLRKARVHLDGERQFYGPQRLLFTVRLT